MKRAITLLVCILFVPVLKGQFKIEGTIKGYGDQQYTLKGHYGTDTKVLGKTKSDSTGSFQFSVSVPYTGTLNLEFQGAQLFLFSDNSDIRFFVDRENKENPFVIHQGVSQKILTQLGEGVTSPKVDSLLIKHPDSFAKYYIDLRNELITLYNTTEATVISETKASILRRFISDREVLEQSGLFRDMLIAYAIQGNKTKIDDSASLLADIEKLLDQVGVDSHRGQLIAKGFIDLLDRERYMMAINRIAELVDCAKCSLDPELEYRIMAIKSMKEGQKIPEIVFDTPNKKKKSIFKVKADYKIIMFWATWCGHCREAMPGVLEKYPALKEKKVELFSVSADTDKQLYEDFSKDHPWYKYIDYKKWNSPAFLKYDIKATPTFVLVDKKNRFIGKYSSLDELEKKIK